MAAAKRLNPFTPSWYNVACAEALYSLRRFAEAVQALKRLPDLGLYEQAWMAACYAQAGQMAEAQDQTGAILRRQPTSQRPNSFAALSCLSVPETATSSAKASSGQDFQNNGFEAGFRCIEEGLLSGAALTSSRTSALLE